MRGYFDVKPEVHCRQKRTEPRPQFTRSKKFNEVWTYTVCEIFERTERQTYRQTCAILGTSTGGEVKRPGSRSLRLL